MPAKLVTFLNLPRHLKYDYRTILLLIAKEVSLLDSAFKEQIDLHILITHTLLKFLVLHVLSAMAMVRLTAVEIQP